MNIHFLEENCSTVSVNYDTYHEIINNFITLKMSELARTNDVYFMQDGETSRATRHDNLWHSCDNIFFFKLLIALCRGMTWSPLCPDLNSYEDCLWGFLKPRVFSVRSENLDYLKNSIRRAID